MMRRMSQRIKRIDDRGAGIVTVLVIISFISILVATLMLTTAVNFKMRSMNVYSKDSFYSAEQVLDEIQVGLQNMVSDGLRIAYAEALQSYSVDSLTADEKNELIRQEYYNFLWENLTDGSGDYTTYIAMPAVQDPNAADADQGLYRFLKPSTRWHGNTGSEETNYGAFLRAGGVEYEGGDSSAPVSYYTGSIKSLENSGVVLEGLEIYYKDSSGFVSAIKTDIKINYPHFSFNNDDVPEVSEYCIIADSGIEGEHGGTPLDLTINGDSYAYSINLKGYNLKYSSAESKKGSSQQIITSDCSITKGALETDSNTTLWASDISANSTAATLMGDTYVRDDFNISGNGSSLSVDGFYTGYGNSVTDPNESSAILINGTDTVVDMRYAKSIMLAGRGFVSTSGKNTNNRIDRVFDNESDKESAGDIYTGETIAIKGNQLMYLVPPECIGVSKVTNKAVYGRNPLPREDYDAMINDENIIEVSGNIGVEKLGYNTLGNYAQLDASGNPVVEKVFVRSAAAVAEGETPTSVVYYYIRFASENAANDYFKTYYSKDTENLEKYISVYLNSLTLPGDATANMRVESAGHIISGDKDVSGYIDRDFILKDIPSRDYQNQSDIYFQQFRALTSKLSDDYDVLEEGGNLMRYNLEDNKAVFLNVIDEDVLKALASSHSGEYTSESGDCKVKFIYDLTAAGRKPEDPDNPKATEYTYDFDNAAPVEITGDYDMVIANCNIKLTKNFRGTIITKGKLVIDGTTPISMTAVSNTTEKCMEILDSTSGYMIGEVFRGAVIGSKANADNTAIDVEDGSIDSTRLVTFDRWIKN